MSYIGPEPSVEQIEAEFWRIVETPDDVYESLYGQVGLLLPSARSVLKGICLRQNSVSSPCSPKGVYEHCETPVIAEPMASPGGAFTPLQPS